MVRALIIIFVVFMAGSTHAQDPAFERIEFTVTAVAGRSVYLDVGRADGLEPGDSVRLFPLAGAVLEGKLRAVSKSSSRAELSVNATVQVGDRGEILIPSSRLAPKPAPKPDQPDDPADDATEPVSPRREEEFPPRPVEEHPPWQDPPAGWDQTVPLLAPSSARSAAERPPRWRGRLWSRFSHTTDNSGTGREFESLRAGADVLYLNPFGRGGEVDLDIEYSRRMTDTGDPLDESDSVLRAERFSYRFGGLRDDPVAWEVGRFLQRGFSEFGLLDGTEYARRLSNGDTVGASIGFLPEPNDQLDTGNDFQGAGYYRYVSNADEDVVLALGYQKTWHNGRADRDLFVATGDWRLADRTYAYGTAWIDWYTGSDAAKSSGPEVTQLFLNVSHRLEGGDGVGVFLSHVKWPSLLRNEFSTVAVGGIADFEVTRIGVNGWTQLRDDVRLSGRLDQWEDQDDSGGGGEIRIDLRDWLYEDGRVSLAIFDTRGATSSGIGWRVAADRRMPAGFVSLTWQTTDFQQDGFDGEQENLLHQVLRASYDTQLAADWDLSLFAEERFGDEQDSRAIGFYLQRRF